MENCNHEDVSAEIEEIMQIYGSNCKIIRNVGDFAYILNIKNIGEVLSVTFQLSGKKSCFNVYLAR